MVVHDTGPGATLARCRSLGSGGCSACGPPDRGTGRQGRGTASVLIFENQDWEAAATIDNPCRPTPTRAMSFLASTGSELPRWVWVLDSDVAISRPDALKRAPWLIRPVRGMSGKSLVMPLGTDLPWQRLADLAVRARVRLSPQGVKEVSGSRPGLAASPSPPRGR